MPEGDSKLFHISCLTLKGQSQVRQGDENFYFYTSTCNSLETAKKTLKVLDGRLSSSMDLKFHSPRQLLVGLWFKILSLTIFLVLNH